MRSHLSKPIAIPRTMTTFRQSRGALRSWGHAPITTFHVGHCAQNHFPTITWGTALCCSTPAAPPTGPVPSSAARARDNSCRQLQQLGSRQLDAPQGGWAPARQARQQSTASSTSCHLQPPSILPSPRLRVPWSLPPKLCRHGPTVKSSALAKRSPAVLHPASWGRCSPAGTGSS